MKLWVLILSDFHQHLLASRGERTWLRQKRSALVLLCLPGIWSLGSPCTTSGLEQRGGSRVLDVVTVMVKVSKCVGRACAAGVHTLSTFKSATSRSVRRPSSLGFVAARSWAGIGQFCALMTAESDLLTLSVCVTAWPAILHRTSCPFSSGVPFPRSCLSGGSHSTEQRSCSEHSASHSTGRAQSACVHGTPAVCRLQRTK